MDIIKTKLEDCVIIEPDIFEDDRGFFLETFQLEKYKKHAGINLEFVQDNHSHSCKNVLRGLHFQINKPQGKLVRVVSGAVYDVAVDLRKNSNTFAMWQSVVLSAENKKQFWIPPGFAHGFLVLSDEADFEYKCTNYYDPYDEGTLLWNDLDINWPTAEPILSDKDKNGKKLSEIIL
jgi:dTDP-4-dehydrorhamnose 3,5-epimerase